MAKQTPTVVDPSKRIKTATLAERFDYSPFTVRKHLCLKGSFFGLTPIKLPNGRNLWPDAWPSDVIGQ
ncbi:hypothetical protein [Desulfurivibrio sp. C05AmB]|uniref:hypothetical protein n=1 Tax=Desulfurivibrio sp. C05AmB TaxID=3374371 RepID=UPI00376F0AAA